MGIDGLRGGTIHRVLLRAIIAAWNGIYEFIMGTAGVAMAHCLQGDCLGIQPASPSRLASQPWWRRDRM